MDDREDYEKEDSDRTPSKRRSYNEMDDKEDYEKEDNDRRSGNEKTNDDADEEYEKEDNDRTPTNEKTNDDGGEATPNAADIEDMQNTIGTIDKALNGEGISEEDLKDIKEEYSSYFDKESGNNTEEGLKEVKDYLHGELAPSLKKGAFDGWVDALNNIDEVSETRSEASTSETSKSSVKESDGLSPLDYVLEKQNSDPIDPRDDLD